MRIETNKVIHKYFEDNIIFNKNFGIKIFDRRRDGFLSHYVFFPCGKAILKYDLQKRIYKKSIFEK